MTSAVAVSAPVEAERTALLRWLQFQRDSVVAVVAGLDPDPRPAAVDAPGLPPDGVVSAEINPGKRTQRKSTLPLIGSAASCL